MEFKVIFTNGRQTFVDADNEKELRSELNKVKSTFDCEIKKVAPMDEEKFSLGGFLTGSAIGVALASFFGVEKKNLSRDRKFVNKAQGHEKSYAKGTSRTGYKGNKKFETGGGVDDFNPRSFTLLELDHFFKFGGINELYEFQDISIVYLKTGDFRNALNKATILVDGVSMDKKNKWATTKLTISDYGQLEMQKGSENLYLDMIVYPVDEDKELTLSIYTKENHQGLKAFSKMLIEKFKTGGGVDKPKADDNIKDILIIDEDKKEVSLPMGYGFSPKDNSIIKKAKSWARKNQYNFKFSGKIYTPDGKVLDRDFHVVDIDNFTNDKEDYVRGSFYTKSEAEKWQKFYNNNPEAKKHEIMTTEEIKLKHKDFGQSYKTGGKAKEQLYHITAFDKNVGERRQVFAPYDLDFINQIFEKQFSKPNPEIDWLSDFKIEPFVKEPSVKKHKPENVIFKFSRALGSYELAQNGFPYNIAIDQDGYYLELWNNIGLSKDQMMTKFKKAVGKADFEKHFDGFVDNKFKTGGKIPSDYIYKEVYDYVIGGDRPKSIETLKKQVDAFAKKENLSVSEIYQDTLDVRESSSQFKTGGGVGKYEYKTIDTRSASGLKEAERLKADGWKIISTGFNTIQFERLKNTNMAKKHSKGGLAGQSAKVEFLSEEFATEELINELKEKAGITGNSTGDVPVIAFAYTDYGGSFLDKVAIQYFQENYPDNIVTEVTGWGGENAFVFGEPAQEWMESTEDYPLGFEDFEEFYTNKEYEAEMEGFEYFIDNELSTDEYVYDRDELLSWLGENRGGYFSVTTQGLDYSTDDLMEAVMESGLVAKMSGDEEFGRGGSAGRSLVVSYSSYFDYNKYDTDVISKVVRENGGKDVHLENDRGWSNQPEVVVFKGDKNRIERALNDAFGTEYIRVSEKDWRSKKFATGGVSSMAMAGASPQLAIANEVSNKLPATTSAIDQRIAERIHPSRSKWEDRGLDNYVPQPYGKGYPEHLPYANTQAPMYAKGGSVGQEITFRHWSGDTKHGTIVEIFPDGSLDVSCGFGHCLVSPSEVISGAEKMARGSKIDEFNDIMENNVITEQQINLIKTRLNSGKLKTDAEIVQYIWDNTPDLTPEQNRKGIEFLMNLYKTPTGKERSNHVFGYREQEALDNFDHFSLAGFHDASKYGQRPYYIPMYDVWMKDGDYGFQYYYDGQVNIVGGKGMKTAGSSEPYSKQFFSKGNWEKITAYLNKRYSKDETDEILGSRLMRMTGGDNYTSFVKFYNEYKSEFDKVASRYAKGGSAGRTNDRNHVNKSQPYEVNYAQRHEGRTGYKGNTKFAGGGTIPTPTYSELTRGNQFVFEPNENNYVSIYLEHRVYQVSGFLNNKKFWESFETFGEAKKYFLDQCKKMSGVKFAGGGTIDNDAVRELQLFLENDGDLYRQKIVPIQKNLMTKLAQGKYDHEMAQKLFMYLVQDADKKYQKEFGSSSSGYMLSMASRKELCKILEEEFYAGAKDGEFDEYIPKKYSGSTIKYKTGGGVRKAPFKVGDMVYSYQNPNDKMRVSFVDDRGVQDGVDYGWGIKVALKTDADGNYDPKGTYSKSSKWMSQNSVSKTKKEKYSDGGTTKLSYKIVEGYDHLKGKPLFHVVGVDNDYVGEYHMTKAEAESEMKSLNGTKFGRGGSTDNPKKPIEFKSSNLLYHGKGKDLKGQRVVRISFPSGRAWSIQTNGNLPKTHSDGYDEKEINEFVKEFGSDTQKKRLKIYK